jgi:hypothetical protein
VGYSVQLIKGEVTIAVSDQTPAFEALRDLDATRDDLKTGWSKDPDGGDRVGRRHWAFVQSEDVASASTLPDMLRALRFRPMVEPDGEIFGVELIDSPRNRGDERWIWATLAPFVAAGGELIWFGEDDQAVRWSFDGRGMTEHLGRLAFDEALEVLVPERRA